MMVQHAGEGRHAGGNDTDLDFNETGSRLC